MKRTQLTFPKITESNFKTEYAKARMSFNSAVREYLPKKSELFNRKGEQLVDDEVIEGLIGTMNEYKTRGKYRTGGKLREDTTLEKAIKGTLGESGLSASERAKLKLLNFQLKQNANAAEAKSISKMSRDATHDGSYYAVGNYLSDGSFDPNRLSSRQLERILDGVTEYNYDGATYEITTDMLKRIKEAHGIEDNEEEEIKRTSNMLLRKLDVLFNRIVLGMTE